MASASNHRELIAWQEAIMLVELIYKETAAFPRDELYGLSAQMRRSAVSIPSNIAEGAGRNSSKQLAQFLGIERVEVGTRYPVSDCTAAGVNRIEFARVRQLERVGQLLTALRRAVQSKAGLAAT